MLQIPTCSVAVGVALLAVGSAVAQVDPDCCCTPHATPSCSDAACSLAVCAADPFCCDVQWDQLCAENAFTLCAELFNDCDGVPGFDGCYLGPAQSAVTVSGVYFGNPDAWTNGVPGRATDAEIWGDVFLGCDHSASQITNQFKQPSYLYMQDYSLRVGALAYFTDVQCQGPGHLSVAALLLDPQGTVSFDNLSIDVDGEFRIGPGFGPGSGTVDLGVFGPVSLECNTFIPDNGSEGGLQMHPGSTLTALNTDEVVLERGSFALPGTVALGGPLRIMPEVWFEAGGTFRTPVFRNDGEMRAALWGPFHSSMVIDGDFENDPGPSELGVDGMGSLRIDTCCDAVQTTPLIDVTGEASLGGLCVLNGWFWWPDYTEVVRAGSLNPARSGFDGLLMPDSGSGLPPGQAPRFVRSQDEQGRQIVGIELVPVQELSYAPQPPAVLLWEPQRNAAFDVARDGFEDHAIAVRNTSTGQGALRVYLNDAGVIGTDYISMALAGPAVDVESVPASIFGEPQMLVVTAPNGLIRVHESGGALSMAGPQWYTALPPNSEGLVAAVGIRSPIEADVVAAVSTTWGGENSTVQFMTPGAHGQWQAFDTKILPGRATCMAAGDLNLDGVDDVAVAVQASPFYPYSVVFGIFGPNFDTVTSRPLAGSPRGVLITRVDDDPYPEIVVANINATEVAFGTFEGEPNMVRGSLQIMRNAGSWLPGYIIASVPLDVGPHARDVTAVDPDRDLDSDFAVVTGASGPGQLVSVRNDSSAGSLLFGAPVVEPSADGAIAVASAHFRPGRRADLLVLENHPLGLLGPDWNGNGLGGMGGGIDGDLDGNGDVDGTDLSMLLGNWSTSDQIADIDADGIVSGADLSILLGNW